MQELMLTQTDDGKTFNIAEGDKVIIRLEENPSTGYIWASDMKDNGSVIAQDSDSFVSSGTDIGSGGLRTIIFTAKKTGSARVNLKLWREWEGDNSIIDRYAVILNVCAKKDA